MTRAEQIAAVLAEHMVVWDNDGEDYGGQDFFWCECRRDKPLGPRDQWLTPAGHAAHVAAALDAALAAQEGERGGAEVAAAVEAVLRANQSRREPFGNDLVSAVRDALAEPAGALAKHDAEVLRTAADDMPIKMWGRDGWQQWLRAEADRIAGDQP